MNWYEIKAAHEDTAEVWIYDEIGESFWGEGVSAKTFNKELSEITAPNIDLHIHSPGGMFFEGQAMHAAISRHPAKVTTIVDGLAASAASLVALAGDEVVMADGAYMMIHNAWSLAMGNASDLRDSADLLDKIDQTQQNTYQRKSGQALSAIQDAMAEETWFTASEAVEFGLADRVEEGLKAAAMTITPEIAARFKNMPRGLTPEKPHQIEPDGEIPDDARYIQVVVNQTHPTPPGAGETNSDGASQKEENQPYDLELERIKLRKKE